MDKNNANRIRMLVILVISAAVIVTGGLFAYQAFSNGDVGGGILGSVIALIILGFAFIVYKRGTDDIKRGLPIQDERSRKVLDKASSKAFYVSLYLLLFVGFISDFVKFRDPAQALNISIGGMALLFLVFWLYYNRKDI